MVLGTRGRSWTAAPASLNSWKGRQKCWTSERRLTSLMSRAEYRGGDGGCDPDVDNREW